MSRGHVVRTALQTPRLVLRSVVEGDAAEIEGLLGEPGVFRFLCDGVPPSAAFVRELVAASAAGFREDGLG